MSQETMLAIITLLSLIVTTGGTAWATWMSYRMQAMKTEQEKNAKASRERWAILDETCQETKAETKAQTDMLNEIVPEGKRIKSVRPGDSTRVERE